MKDVVLVVLGAIIGIAVKALVEPLLARRSRQEVRGEKWLEDAMHHSDRVLAHMQSVRSKVTASLRFDSDAIAREILRNLSSEFGPEPLEDAANHRRADESIGAFASQAREAWLAIRIAHMDDEHGVQADDALREPLYALQWYSTALGNFSEAARQRLSGS